MVVNEDKRWRLWWLWRVNCCRLIHLTKEMSTIVVFFHKERRNDATIMKSCFFFARNIFSKTCYSLEDTMHYIKKYG